MAQVQWMRYIINLILFGRSDEANFQGASNLSRENVEEFIDFMKDFISAMEISNDLEIKFILYHLGEEIRYNPKIEVNFKMLVEKLHKRSTILPFLVCLDYAKECPNLLWNGGDEFAFM